LSPAIWRPANGQLGGDASLSQPVKQRERQAWHVARNDQLAGCGGTPKCSRDRSHWPLAGMIVLNDGNAGEEWSVPFVTNDDYVIR
jgi:hypothetical protein